MPLPKDYYDLINQAQSEDRISSGVFEDLAFEEDRESGSLYDALGGAVWGGLSGLTWGVSEHVTPYGKTWEEMNDAERAGWVLGEGASLFAPIGAFGLMGKGSRAIAKAGGNKFIKEAADTAADAGISKLSKDQAKAVVKAQSKGVKFSDNISRGLDDVATDDIGVTWVKDLAATGTAAKNASRNLIDSSTNAVTKAFKEADVPITLTDASRIAKGYVDNLADGRYVNDVAEWTERTLRGVAPGGVREGVSKYLGMATQDLMMMSTHSLISGKIKALANNEEFDATGALSHSGLMALGFPLIRLIPGGGMDKAGTGVKMLFDKYRGSNYEAIRAKHGDKVIKNLLKVMVKGGKFNRLNNSKLGDAFWKAGGKTYKGGNDILNSLDDMPVKDAMTLLEKMRGVANKDIMSKWGPQYIKDLAFSVPRMATGVVAMNPWILQKGAWNQMGTSELGSHLFMSALMTKGRGAWGHKAQRAYFADFTPEREVLHLLNVDADSVDKVMKFHTGRLDLIGMGAAMSGDPTTEQIVKVFDAALKDSKTDHLGHDYSNADHRTVGELIDIYNLVKSHSNEGYQPIEVTSLTKRTLNRLVKELNDIQFEDGTTIKEHGVEGTLVKMTLGPAKKGINYYKEMLARLGSELGYDVGVTIDKDTGDYGKVTGSEIRTKNEGVDIDAAHTYNRILKELRSLGEAEILNKEGQADEVLVETILRDKKISMDELTQRTREIIGEHLDMIGAEYGDKLVITDAVEGSGPNGLNPYFEFFQQAKNVEANERLYKVITNTADGQDARVTSTMDALFKLKDGRYASSIYEYKKIITDWSDKELAEGSKEKKAVDSIVDNMDALKDMFNARKRILGGTSKESIITGNKFSSGDLNISKNHFKEMWKGLPHGFKQNWQNHFEQLYLERHLKSQDFDRRAIQLVHYMLGENLAWMAPDRTLEMPPIDGIKLELRDQGYSEKDIKLVEDSYRNIKTVLGDQIKESEFTPTEGNRRFFEEVDIEKFVGASKLLGNEMMTDLMINVGIVMDKISLDSTGTRERVKSVHTRISNLIEKLDPATEQHKSFDAIREINEIVIEVDAIINVSRLKSTETDLNGIVIQLGTIKDNIDAISNKFKTGARQMLTETERLEGDSFTIHSAITRPMQKTLEKIYNKELEGIDKLQTLVTRMENLALTGKSGLGLNQSSISSIMEALAVEWNEVYKGKTAKGTKVLSELITEVNENGTFGDVIKVIEGINKEINKRVIIDNEHHPLNNDAKKALAALEKANNIDEHHRTPAEILKEYDLVDKNNKVDQGFSDAVLKNPITALNDYVKSKIDSQTDKTSIQKEKEWHRFREKDAIELLMNIENSQPIRKVRIFGVTDSQGQRSVAEFTNDAANIEHPNTKYFDKKGMKVVWIDDTVSVADAGGKLRNTSLDSWNNPMTIQAFINKAIRTNSEANNIIDAFRSQDAKLTPEMIKTMMETPDKYLFYARVSPMNKLLFIATEKNLKVLDKDFTDWYDSTVKRYRKAKMDKEADKFEQMFAELKDKANDARDTVELKLMLPYIDNVGKRSEFDKMMTEHAGLSRQGALAKIEANIFKRGFLSDGGTTQPMSESVLKWMAHRTKGHPKKEIQKIAREILKNKGYRSGVLNDELSTGLNIKNITLDKLNVIGQTAPQLIKDLVEAQKKDMGDKNTMNSLDASLLDGAKFVSLRMAKLIMSSKGMLKESFRDSPNGGKTIIFATGDNQMLGKGYAIYHPEVAKNMPADVDILIGGSSAKTFSGTSMHPNNLPIEAFNIPSGRKASNWVESLNQMGQESKMILPVESLGVSFTSKNAKGVTISPSIFDFQSPTTIDKAVKWMQFDAKLKDLNTAWNNIHEDGGRLAQFLIDINEAEGNPLDKGDTGLTRMILEYGAMPNNPLVTKALRRLLRSQNYKQLGKSTNLNGGEDNFIVPNVSGDLSIPLYAKLVDKVDNSLSQRVSVRYGGAGLNRNMAKRLMGNGTTSNLEGEMFIIRNEYGIDEVVTMENGKLTFDSSFYDNYNKDTHQIGTGKMASLALPQSRKGDATSRKLNEFFKELNKKVIDNDLSYNEVFRLLQGGTVRRKGRNIGLGLSSYAKDFKIQLGTFNHAIPSIGHDKTIMRVEKIMDEMMGLVEVNVHDLRTVHQRDNDGDHMYTHTRVPREILKEFVRENGRKDDFNMFNTEDIMNRDYINILGLGPNNKVGERATEVGFQKYAGTLHQAKRTIGSIIGGRNALSWLGRLGMTYKGEDVILDVNDSMNRSMKGFEWKFLDKFYDIVQNSVDIHGGVHEVLRTERALKDFLFFGELESSHMKNLELNKNNEDADFTFTKHALAKANILKSKSLRKRGDRITKEIFYEILNTLKKVNGIQNDVWDERGSRSPEPDELRTIYYNINALFNNPTGYLSRRMLRKIYLTDQYEDLSGETGKALRNEYIDFFYGDAYNVKTPKERNNLYRDIIKGKADDALVPVFKFNNIKNITEKDSDGQDFTVNTGFKMSTSGYILQGLLGTRGFWGNNYGGIPNGNKKMYDKAGLFVRNIETFVETAKAFGDNPSDILGKDMNIDVTSFGSGATTKIKQSLNNGILRELLNRQHRKLMNSMDYFRAEKFTNPYKIEKLTERISNMQKAIDIMDVMVARDMVIDPKKIVIKDFENIKKSPQLKFNYLKDGQKVAVYRVRGDVRSIEAEDGKNLNQFNVDGNRIDYSQLEYVGMFSNKGRVGKGKNKLYGSKGYSYIIDHKPVTQISITSNESRYSRALFEATYGIEAPAESFLREGSSDFRSDVNRLRASMSFDYIKTVKDALSNRVLSDNVFALQNAKDARAVDEFVDTWLNRVDPNRTTEPLDLILRSLLQPQLVPSRYYKDSAGNELPVFKTNEHLYKVVMDWAIRNGHEAFVKQLVNDVEWYAAGNAKEPDTSFYDRSIADRYEWEKLGPMANTWRSLARHIGTFFGSPLLNAKLDGVLPKSRRSIETIEGNEGEQIPVRRTAKETVGEFWKFYDKEQGDGC